MARPTGSAPSHPFPVVWRPPPRRLSTNRALAFPALDGTLDAVHDNPHSPAQLRSQRYLSGGTQDHRRHLQLPGGAERRGQPGGATVPDVSAQPPDHPPRPGQRQPGLPIDQSDRGRQPGCCAGAEHSRPGPPGPHCTAHGLPHTNRQPALQRGASTRQSAHPRFCRRLGRPDRCDPEWPAAVDPADAYGLVLARGDAPRGVGLRPGCIDGAPLLRAGPGGLAGAGGLLQPGPSGTVAAGADHPYCRSGNPGPSGAEAERQHKPRASDLHGPTDRRGGW